jgi:hypothetical protein
VLCGTERSNAARKRPTAVKRAVLKARAARAAAQAAADAAARAGTLAAARAAAADVQHQYEVGFSQAAGRATLHARVEVGQASGTLAVARFCPHSQATCCQCQLWSCAGSSGSSGCLWLCEQQRIRLHTGESLYMQLLSCTLHLCYRTLCDRHALCRIALEYSQHILVKQARLPSQVQVLDLARAEASRRVAEASSALEVRHPGYAMLRIAMLPVAGRHWHGDWRPALIDSPCCASETFAYVLQVAETAAREAAEQLRVRMAAPPEEALDAVEVRTTCRPGLDILFAVSSRSALHAQH